MLDGTFARAPSRMAGKSELTAVDSVLTARAPEHWYHYLGRSRINT